MKTPIYHWRKTKGLKPPCGKVSMYMAEDRSRVTCPECLKAISLGITVEVKSLGVTGWAVVAGTREQLDNDLGLAVASFHQSVNPTLYQSITDAERRARACVKLLQEDFR
jgi:hypothetical protein